MPLSLQIALRFRSWRRRGGIVSLISFISTISIAIGVAVLIIGLSAMNGFERELNNRILAIVHHGEVEPIGTSFNDWRVVLEHIQQVPGIIAAAPYLNFTGLVGRDNKLQVIRITGVDPVLETQLSALPRYVQASVWECFHSGQQQIIIGKGIADVLKVKPGDWLTVMIPSRNPQMKLLQPKRIRLVVSGVLMLNSQLDHSLAIVPLADAQSYLQCGDDVEGIAIKVSNIFNANKLVRDAGEVSDAYVKIHSWMSTYGYMYQDIQTIRTIIYLAMVLVISVACFSIISTLILAVKDKSAEIAILRTLGAKDRLTSTIFIWYGLLAGLTGGSCGVVGGVLITFNLTYLVKWLERMLGHRLLSNNVYFIDFLPTELHWINVINVLMITLSLSLLATWYPVRYANHINPAKVLSNQ